MFGGSEGFGLKLGESEDKQKILRDERQKEYKLYLEEQSVRHNHNNKMSTETYLQGNRNQVAQKHEDKKHYKSNIDKEYQTLLKNKKNEETLYRTQFNGTDESYNNNDGRKSAKKFIEFDSDDDELFKFVLRQKAKRRQQSAEHVRGNNVNNYEDGRSSSVPPMVIDKECKEVTQQTSFNYVADNRKSPAPAVKVPYIFGGSSHAMIKKERNKEYKKALEDQIKEKQRVQYREKLKRMGKITSETDIGEYEKSLNQPKKLEKITQYSHQGIAHDTSSSNKAQNRNPDMNVVNQNNYPPTNQANYPMNPMFNPMMNYNPVGWPQYGGMMPTGFMPPNSMTGYQQVPTHMPQTNLKKTRIISGSHRDEAGNVESTEKVISAYVPSAVDKNNNSNPGTMMNMMSPRETDQSAKRAQQMVYQEELRKQMETKKASVEKDKMANKAYQMKLERDIANYDPWGKSGCGAPVRNNDGSVVADLKKFMQSKDLPPKPAESQNPDELSEDLSPILRALELIKKPNESIDSNKTVDATSKYGDNTTTYLRGAALKELQGQNIKSPREKNEQDNYKKYLQQQVEDRKRKEEELKEQALLEEQKENRRLADQQQKMLQEFEEEKEKQRKKEEEIRQQNEALRLLAEQKRSEEDQKRKEILEDREEDRKREGQMKLVEMAAATTNTELPIVKADPVRSNSPPVPAITTKGKRKKDKNYKQRNAVLLVEKTDSEQSMDYLNNIRASIYHENKDRDDNLEEQRNLIRQLSALRQQLQHQEMRVKTDLQKNQTKYSNLVSGTGWNDPPQKFYKQNAFDRATNITSGRKHQREKQQYQHQIDNDYSNYEQKDLDSQQQTYMRQQELRLLELRQSVDERTSEFEMNRQRVGSKQSLLESDSKFVSLDENEEIKVVKSRNNSKQKERLQENNNLNRNITGASNMDDTTSITTLQVEDIARRNEERLVSLQVEEVAEGNGERLDMLTKNNDIEEEDLDDETIVENFMQNK